MTTAAVATAPPVPRVPMNRTFARAQRSALHLVMRVRLWASLAISLFLLAQFPSIIGLYWVALIGLFGVLGWAHYRLELLKGGVGWHSYLFIALDAALVTFAISYPNPLVEDAWPIQVSFRYHSFPYYFIFFSFTALGFAPRLVLWSGFMCAVCWLTVGVSLLALPESISFLDLPDNSGLPAGAEKMRMSLDPRFVNISQFIQDAFVILVVSGILATAVHRARRLVRRQAAAERERTNLARYFSPTMVEELSQMDDPLGEVRSQNAAILFADLVGFTQMSERQTPERIIALLREFHGLMAREIFRFEGTVDKYIGDAVMATFGTPRQKTGDALNAIRCAQAMVEAVDSWNREREAEGEEPVRIGVGLHYGPVVLGDIGDERRLEFAVIGDTVNVAARLEELTRRHGVDILLSKNVVEAAKRAGPEADRWTDRVTVLAAEQVRGRAEPVEICTLATTHGRT